MRIARQQRTLACSGQWQEEKEIYVHRSDQTSFRLFVAPWHPLQFPQYYAREMLPKITLKREKAHTCNYGDAASFHEWEFRTRLYIAGKTGDQYIEAMSKVCAGLRGDAIIAAQEAGFDNLREIIDGRPYGIEALISHMRETVFLSTEYEPERLFSHHCRSEGPLSKKNGKLWNSMSRGDDVAGHP